MLGTELHLTLHGSTWLSDVHNIHLGGAILQRIGIQEREEKEVKANRSHRAEAEEWVGGRAQRYRRKGVSPEPPRGVGTQNT